MFRALPANPADKLERRVGIIDKDQVLLGVGHIEQPVFVIDGEVTGIVKTFRDGAFELAVGVAGGLHAAHHHP